MFRAVHQNIDLQLLLLQSQLPAAKIDFSDESRLVSKTAHQKKQESKPDKRRDRRRGFEVEEEGRKYD